MKQQRPMHPISNAPSALSGTAAATDTARLALRYRPHSDVLIGVVEHSDAAPADAARAASSESVEVLDADARLVWNVPAHGPHAGQPTLASFELVHALARWDADGLPMLARPIAEACVHEAQRHLATLHLEANPLARIGYRGDSTITVLRSELTRAADAPRPSPPGTQVNALRVARALESFADGLEQASARTALGRFHDEQGDEYAGQLDADRAHADTHHLEQDRTLAMCDIARELASTLADHDALPAPGTSAAARQALAGGLPLGFGERAALRAALTHVDQADAWPAVAAAVQSIADALHAPHLAAGHGQHGQRPATSTNPQDHA